MKRLINHFWQIFFFFSPVGRGHVLSDDVRSGYQRCRYGSGRSCDRSVRRIPQLEALDVDYHHKSGRIRCRIGLRFTGTFIQIATAVTDWLIICFYPQSNLFILHITDYSGGGFVILLVMAVHVTTICCFNGSFSWTEVRRFLMHSSTSNS
jgi:hypothetical protein